MRLALLLTLLTAPAALPAEAQPTSPETLRASIDAVLADTAFADAFWGVHVVDLATGETLYAHDAGHNFVPASNQKLLTTAAALDALGPDFRYETRLYLDGARRDSTLDGNLVVRGSGDPTISDRRFEPDYPTDGDPLAVFRGWADSLKAFGVRAVTGHVVGDDDAFDDLLLGNGWAWDDEPTPYAAQISALSFNEGRLRISAEGTAPGRRARVEVEPETDYVFVANRARTVGRNDRGDSELRREPGSNTIWLESEVPAGREYRRTVSVHNPTRYFVHALRDVLRAEGVAVDGDPVDGDDWQAQHRLDYGSMTLAATHTSPPLAELVALTNKESQNLYAEHLLRTLGSTHCGVARARAEEAGYRRPERVDCGSAEAGLLAAGRLFERAGMRTERMRVRDGSGMSPYNMVAPVDLTALLAAMWGHEDEGVREAFVQSLAVGGGDGTLERRFRRGRARGNVRAKTGTVTGAKNLSGYVTSAAGTPLAFSILTNLYGTTTGTVTRAQDAIVELLAGYRD